MNVEMIVHVDDLFVVGPLENVTKVYHGLAESFEMKCKYAGPETGNNEVEYLGRRIVFTADGVEIHGDPKHAAILLKEMGMDMCKPMGSPHVVDAKSLDALADETRDFMPPSEARRHRSAVARVVYMAQDRPDLDVAACTLSRTMARPRKGDEVLVKRVCRYIKGRPRYAQVYEYQERAGELVVQTDSDWASCRATRRSNSGGWLYLGIGNHLLHHWCRVQARVALSTGEAELYAQVRGLQEMLSMKYILEELRPSERSALRCITEVDSTACKGILLRHGVGQLKHLATRTMWAQQVLQREGIEVRRIPRDVNSADCLASHNSPRDLHRGIVRMGGKWPGVDVCFEQE